MIETVDVLKEILKCSPPPSSALDIQAEESTKMFMYEQMIQASKNCPHSNTCFAVPFKQNQKNPLDGQ